MNKKQISLLAAFAAAGVEYAVVGGMAVKITSTFSLRLGPCRSIRVWRNRVETMFEGLLIPFISKADLIENKRRVGRLRDLADVEELDLIPEPPEGSWMFTRSWQAICELAQS